MAGTSDGNDDLLRANRRRWDELVSIHAGSDFYDVDGFLAGRSTLHALERDELGEVAGRSLVHLQCHFGLDTLSWARLGARVTGIDFSAPAIEKARELASRAGLEATFLQSDLYALPGLDRGPFDIAFTSYGAVCWLPDLSRWASVVRGLLRPGGTFYMAEVHPASGLFDEEAQDGLRVKYPYAPGKPLRWEEEGTYADREARVEHRTHYVWDHGLGEIVSALTGAGLRLEFLREHPFTVFRQFPFLRRAEDGTWRLPPEMPEIPLLFSLRAVRGD